VIAVRPSLAPHAAPSWHRHACSARVLVIRTCLAPRGRIQPLDHLGLVWKVARHYARAYPHCGLEVEDLAQEGWFGLCIACERYDPGRRTKFSTLANWWIRSAIVSTIEDQPHPIRVPRGVRKDYHKEQAGILDPDTGLSAGARACLDAARPLLANPPVQEIRSDEEGPCLADLAADPREADPAWADLDGADDPRPLRGPITDDRIRVRDAFAALTGRERDVIRLGCGLDGGDPLTHAQVAARLGLTRNGCRGIRVRAVRRLRAMLGVAPPVGNQRKGG
jgi:RNA polymerase sigma factor (sigma-70 family)